MSESGRDGDVRESRITVITANTRDFAKLGDVRPFQWGITNPRASQGIWGGRGCLDRAARLH
jgi:hypothetical protein